MNRFAAFIPMVLLMILSLTLTSCDKGDYLGPLERGARELFNGWDMWSCESVRPYEEPMPGTTEKALKITGQSDYESGVAELTEIPEQLRLVQGKQAYRRFCYHCHGPNGDSRIIVGESFDVRLPDLRSAEIQAKNDEMVFRALYYGSENMIPLAATVAPGDMLLAILYIRTLANAPSEPCFAPKSTKPIQ